MKEVQKTMPASGDMLAIYQALDRVQAIIEFDLDGTVVSANENFLGLFGYEVNEVIGKHHRMFCDPAYVESDAYAEFWKKLGRGEFHAAEFKRLTKGGREIWLQASYNPVFDKDGKPVRVVKFATDVTASKLQIAEYEGKIRAIERAQAVIEFELDGTVITANENFLRIFGYKLDEVVGKHHRIFCDPGYAESLEYARFWQKLGRGEYEADEFKRITKDGAEVWLQASYNPIFDMEGRPLKVVKSLAFLLQSHRLSQSWVLISVRSRRRRRLNRLCGSPSAGPAPDEKVPDQADLANTSGRVSAGSSYYWKGRSNVV